jgi:hypothetical protein
LVLVIVNYLFSGEWAGSAITITDQSIIRLPYVPPELPLGGWRAAKDPLFLDAPHHLDR